MTTTDPVETATTEEVDPRTERTRRAIEIAAQHLLHEGGPDAVTHAQVAAGANVSRTTVYKHHPTRSSLIRAAIEIEDPFPQEFSGDLRTDLMTMVLHLVEELGDDDSARMFAAFMERKMSDPELQELGTEMVCRGRDLFAQLLDDAERAGQLRPGIDADHAMAGLIGTLLFRRFLANQPVDEGVAADVIDHFLTHHAPR